MRLADRTIILTGGASGLGNSMAHAFVEEGAQVVCADVDEQRLDDTVAELTDAGGDAIGVRTDVRSWESAQALIETALDAFGNIDILVNNAGVQQRTAGGETRAPVVDVRVDIWEQVIETNLTGTFHCTKAVLPHLLDADAGRIIHISSGAGTEGRANRSPYVSSKFGIEGFHECLADELAGTGVESVTLRPPGGGIATPSRSHRDPEEFTHHTPDVIREPAVLVASGEVENGGRYLGTDDGEGLTTYSK